MGLTLNLEDTGVIRSPSDFDQIMIKIWLNYSCNHGGFRPQSDWTSSPTRPQPEYTGLAVAMIIVAAIPSNFSRITAGSRSEYDRITTEIQPPPAMSRGEGGVGDYYACSGDYCALPFTVHSTWSDSSCAVERTTDLSHAHMHNVPSPRISKSYIYIHTSLIGYTSILVHPRAHIMIDAGMSLAPPTPTRFWSKSNCSPTTVR